ncbi:MAG: ABC transporter permease [Ktedonobacterales bacterium]
MSTTNGFFTARTATPHAEGNVITQTWRLTRWYLFTIRRRILSKILLGILAAFFLIVVVFNLLGFLILSTTPSAGSNLQCPPTAIGTSQSGGQSGNSGPTCQQVQQQEQQQEISALKTAADAERQSLTFPYTLSIAGGYLGSIGIILFCIVVAALVGGEYSSGTLRLALSRGTRRGQVITAQLCALAILSMIVAAIVLVLGAVAGLTIGPVIGGSLPSFSPAFGTELLAYWLANSLAIFTFGLIAFFMSTLTRSLIAGIAVALGYLIVESIVGNILYYAGVSLHTSLGDFLSHIPDYLVGYNTGALAHVAAASPIALYSSSSSFTSSGSSSGTVSASTALAGPGSGIDTVHALIVILVYCVVLGGLSYLFLRRRDVTE